MIFAVAFGSTMISANDWGMAGCGLGAVIFGAEGNQILASTTNGIYGNQSFGITSGTSNCTDDGAAYLKHQQEVFAHVNYKGLKQDMAAGQGEKLDAFANLLGCPAAKLASVSKENHKEFFADSENPSNLLSAVKSNTELASACTNL